MTTERIREDLLTRLPELEDDESLLTECINVCTTYKISGEDFFFKFETLRFKGKDSSRISTLQPVTPDVVEDIRKTLIFELQKKRAKEQSGATGPRRPDGTGAFKRMMRNHNNSSKSKGHPPIESNGDALKIEYSGPSSSEHKQQKYRYMYEKVSERSEVLDERLDEFGELVREFYGFEDIGDPSTTTEEDVVVVGRICGDADASSSTKLSDGSIFIEPSRMQGSGVRVPLRFSPDLKLRRTVQGAGGLGLFPGAIVTLKGKNGGGGFFVVNEIIGLPPLPPSSEPTRQKAFSLVVACGPYSVDSDLQFKQFRTLMERVSASKPSVLLLLGPFIDSSNTLIRNGSIDKLPEDIFREIFKEGLESFLASSPDSLVFVQPSIRDMLSDHPVYPQCALENKYLSNSRIKMISNPCRFSINGISIATTSVDILVHLKNQEYMQRGQEIDSIPPPAMSSATDMFSNLYRHVISQRSFYPLFPVPQDLSSDVNLDVSHSDGLRLSPDQPASAPDILVSPSKFKQFAKLIDSTWAVNPSFLTKGTFAKIIIPSLSRSDLRDNIGCEIVKL